MITNFIAWIKNDDMSLCQLSYAFGFCSTTPLVSSEELHQALKSLPAWSLNPEGTQIARSFVAKNFVAAITFFEEIAKVAEEASHHPDLHLTGYRNVEVSSSFLTVRPS